MSDQSLKRMLKFTLAKGSADFALRAELVISINRSMENKLTTFVTTTIMGPQGPMAYEVKEGFDYVLEHYEAALEDRPPIIMASGLISN